MECAAIIAPKPPGDPRHRATTKARSEKPLRDRDCHMPYGAPVHTMCGIWHMAYPTPQARSVHLVPTSPPCASMKNIPCWYPLRTWYAVPPYLLRVGVGGARP
eukprot:scaffold226342_cov33-Tisochrysis_lutea.AAC.1